MGRPYTVARVFRKQKYDGRNRALHSWPGCRGVGGARPGGGLAGGIPEVRSRALKHLCGGLCAAVDNCRGDVLQGRAHEPKKTVAEPAISACAEPAGPVYARPRNSAESLDEAPETLETVELAGLGGRALRGSGGAGREEDGKDPGGAPVFVDASGRRSRKIRRIGWGVAVLCAAYAVALIAALVGGGSTAPLLNIPGVPELADKGKPARTVRPDPAPSASASATPAGPGAAPTAADTEGDGVPDAALPAAAAGARGPSAPASAAPHDRATTGGLAAAGSTGTTAGTKGRGGATTAPRSSGSAGGGTGATTSGASGASGATGTSGSSGTAGSGGSTGTADGTSGGTTGSTAGTGGDTTGASGTTGAGGTTGAPGDPAGGATTGTTGTSGTTGTPGTTGTGGTPGDQGAPDSGTRAADLPGATDTTPPEGTA
ncbi:hypothetical protein GCM10023082_60860 [Streptomyces tremellae]|uniref:Uncharacterized protein n=1 Tax=Streptomyces tremellae TaxID=1124239 RepID=A0ABP7G970_9ACTN